MEIYNPTPSYSRYKTLMHGKGLTPDGYYIYQEGEGLGSMLGQLLRRAVPILKSGIKGAVNIAKPHLKNAASDLVKSGSKKVIEKLSSEVINSLGNKRKRKRRRL